MRICLIKLIIVATIFSINLTPLTVNAAQPTNKQNQFLTQSVVQLKEDFRKVWIEHAIWTRNYLYSSILELENKEQTLARLLKNQEDIGAVITPYYGKAASKRLTELMKEHIAIGGKVISAIKTGNQEEFAKHNKSWYRNSDDIAQFLSSANPNWNRSDLQKMLHMHLEDVTTNTKFIVNKDWSKDIKAFDHGELHLIMIADTLTEGILKQYPEKF
ncbi:MAG: glycosyltransferase [Bacillales bacterium]|jgi:ribosomal protein L20|nr:glycosyltransferase [Bacillales bacterium]